MKIKIGTQKQSGYIISYDNKIGTDAGSEIKTETSLSHNTHISNNRITNTSIIQAFDFN